MKLPTKPVAYYIACYKGEHLVVGHAIDLPKPFADMRFCARRDGKEWVIDHYDSGLAMIGPVVNALEERKGRLNYMRRWQRDTASRDRAVSWLVRYLRRLHRKQSVLLADIRIRQSSEVHSGE